MTELEIYKFIQDKEIDWRGDKLYLWIEPSDLTEFANLIGYDYLAEGGISVTMITEGTIVVELAEHLEWYGIDPERILAREIN